MAEPLTPTREDREDAFQKVESYIYGLEWKALSDIRPVEVQEALETLRGPRARVAALEEARFELSQTLASYGRPDIVEVIDDVIRSLKTEERG